MTYFFTKFSLWTTKYMSVSIVYFPYLCVVVRRRRVCGRVRGRRGLRALSVYLLLGEAATRARTDRPCQSEIVWILGHDYEHRYIPSHLHNYKPF